MTGVGRVVILTGPPGSGKTSAARVLAQSFDRGVHLESDWYYRWIVSGFVPPHLIEARVQNQAVIDIVADSAGGYAAAGYDVVWDGVVGPWFLDQVRRRLARWSVEPEYVVLRPDREVCLARVRERDGTTDTSGAAVMWDEFGGLGLYENNVVDSAGSVEEVAARVRDLL